MKVSNIIAGNGNRTLGELLAKRESVRDAIREMQSEQRAIERELLPVIMAEMPDAIRVDWYKVARETGHAYPK